MNSENALAQRLWTINTEKGKKYINKTLTNQQQQKNANSWSNWTLPSTVTSLLSLTHHIACMNQNYINYLHSWMYLNTAVHHIYIFIQYRSVLSGCMGNTFKQGSYTTLGTGSPPPGSHPRPSSPPIHSSVLGLTILVLLAPSFHLSTFITDERTPTGGLLETFASTNRHSSLDRLFLNEPVFFNDLASGCWATVSWVNGFWVDSDSGWQWLGSAIVCWRASKKRTILTGF